MISVICYSPNRNKDMPERKLWWFGSPPVRLGSMINSLWFVRLTLESQLLNVNSASEIPSRQRLYVSLELYRGNGPSANVGGINTSVFPLTT